MTAHKTLKTFPDSCELPDEPRPIGKQLRAHEFRDLQAQAGRWLRDRTKGLVTDPTQTFKTILRWAEANEELRCFRTRGPTSQCIHDSLVAKIRRAAEGERG